MQQVTRGLCSSVLTRANTANVLPYFINISLTVGIIQLLIYLLFHPHTTNMPHSASHSYSLKSITHPAAILALRRTWLFAEEWLTTTETRFSWVSRSGDKSSWHANNPSQKRTISILMHTPNITNTPYVQVLFFQKYGCSKAKKSQGLKYYYSTGYSALPSVQLQLCFWTICAVGSRAHLPKLLSHIGVQIGLQRENQLATYRMLNF